MDNLVKFVAFTLNFQKIKRVVLIREEEYENDAEHSYQLALVAMYLIDKEKLPLNLTKVLCFALIHDLVEVYAGDTYVFGKESYKETKQQREAEALLQIQKEFPEFTSFSDLVHSYEKHDSEEAKFVYALDKILPVIIIYLDEGRTWHRENATYQMIRDIKDKKISVSPEIEKYWKEFLIVLENDKEKLFAQER
jgi:putative hydrolases of HD superfamily